uniref:YqaJ viral recombinase domain-containing protein n=1 Tax=Oryzias latipes TaxID=8090 RepID=A0A3P9HVM8_ORYLA
MTMRKQSARQTSAQTLPSQKPVLPQVRYHPSIQVPADAVLTKTASKGKTWTRTATARPLQTRTNTKDVKGKRFTNPTGPAVRPDPDGEEKPEEEPGPPTPEQLPLDSEIQIDQDLVGQIEAWTRGQRLNEHWFTWRKNRITASVAHGIAHCRFVNGKSQTPPQSYLEAVTGEGQRVQTRAMSWGVHMEAEAVRRYQVLKSEALGHPVSVLDCGLYVDPERAWLAASPDGIVTDSRTGRRLLVLEVKCPFKHRHRRVEDACSEDPAFCLQLQPGHPPQYRLKTSHSYFTQIQCQLAVTGLQRADLVVFTLQETAVVPVSFQPELWQETVCKLELFYRSAVLPHIRLKKQHCAGPAARTEC